MGLAPAMVIFDTTKNAFHKFFGAGASMLLLVALGLPGGIHCFGRLSTTCGGFGVAAGLQASPTCNQNNKA